MSTRTSPLPVRSLSALPAGARSTDLLRTGTGMVDSMSSRPAGFEGLDSVGSPQAMAQRRSMAMGHRAGSITIGNAPTTTTPTAPAPPTDTATAMSPGAQAARQAVISRIMALYDDRGDMQSFIRIINDASVAAGEGPVDPATAPLNGWVREYLTYVDAADFTGDAGRQEYFDVLTGTIGRGSNSSFVYPPKKDNDWLMILLIIGGIAAVGLAIWWFARGRKGRR